MTAVHPVTLDDVFEHESPKWTSLTLVRLVVFSQVPVPIREILGSYSYVQPSSTQAQSICQAGDSGEVSRLIHPTPCQHQTSSIILLAIVLSWVYEPRLPFSLN